MNQLKTSLSENTFPLWVFEYVDMAVFTYGRLKAYAKERMTFDCRSHQEQSVFVKKGYDISTVRTILKGQ